MKALIYFFIAFLAMFIFEKFNKDSKHVEKLPIGIKNAIIVISLIIGLVFSYMFFINILDSIENLE